MWRKNAFDRFTLPVAVFLKRLAAPLCVLSFGIFPLLLPAHSRSLTMNFAYREAIGLPLLRRLHGRLRHRSRLLRLFVRLLSRLFCARRQDQVQGVTFLTRAELHNSLVANIFNQALQ